ncbi:MAG TPA: hypothetical protein PKW90_22500 [Myxococcota bacterium]|nr:hypothetical protein [Myxococcota bacterium]
MRDPSLFPLLLPWTGGAAPLVAVAWPQIKETWIEAEYPLRSGLGGVAAALRAADLGVRTPGGATVGHYRLHLGTSQPLSGRSAELPIAAALLCAWHRALVRPLLSEPWPVDRAPVAASGKLDEEGVWPPIVKISVMPRERLARSGRSRRPI